MSDAFCYEPSSYPTDGKTNVRVKLNGTNNFAIFNNLIFHHSDSSWIKKLASWSFCIFYAQQIA